VTARTENWGNGPVEGQVKHVETIGGLLHGLVGFELPRGASPACRVRRGSQSNREAEGQQHRHCGTTPS
jgi:hypothetical protein